MEGIKAQTGVSEISCVGYPGELMLSALKELVLPLIAFALMTGVLNLRKTRVG